MNEVYFWGLALYAVFVVFAVGLYFFRKKYGQPPPGYVSYLTAAIVLGAALYLSGNQFVYPPELYPGISEEVTWILQNQADAIDRLYAMVIFVFLFVGVWLFQHGYEVGHGKQG